MQIKDVESIAVTIKTGGLSKDMEAEFSCFLKNEGIDSELNVNAIGNPSAELTAAGLDFVKVKQFLDKKAGITSNKNSAPEERGFILVF